MVGYCWLFYFVCPTRAKGKKKTVCDGFFGCYGRKCEAVETDDATTVCTGANVEGKEILHSTPKRGLRREEKRRRKFKAALLQQ